MASLWKKGSTTKCMEKVTCRADGRAFLTKWGGALKTHVRGLHNKYKSGLVHFFYYCDGVMSPLPPQAPDGRLAMTGELRDAFMAWLGAERKVHIKQARRYCNTLDSALKAVDGGSMEEKLESKAAAEAFLSEHEAAIAELLPKQKNHRLCTGLKHFKAFLASATEQSSARSSTSGSSGSDGDSSSDGDGSSSSSWDFDSEDEGEE